MEKIINNDEEYYLNLTFFPPVFLKLIYLLYYIFINL